MSKSNNPAAAGLSPSAQSLIDQAQALQDFRNAQRHVDNLQQFIDEEAARRRARLLDARQRLVRLGAQKILDEIDAARREVQS